MSQSLPLRGTSLQAILYSIGLRNGLTLCLDARDSRSYPGTGIQLLDISGGGYDFNFGDGVTPTTYPTFNGTANSRAAYLSFDGGDYLQYEAANAAWMDNMHKAAATWSWIFGFYHTTAAFALMGTNGASGTAGTGVNITVSNTDLVSVRCRNATAQVMASSLSAAALTENAWNFVGVSVDAAAGASGGKVQVNGAAETFDATYTSPAAGASTNRVTLLGAVGAAAAAPNGTRLAYSAAWPRALSAAELTRAYTALRRSLGI